MTVDDPLARLTAGLAEDEKRAEAELRVRELERDMYGISMADIRIPGEIRDGCDPRRVPHEVALKRLILREHAPVEGTEWRNGKWVTVPVCEGCSEWLDREENHYLPWPCDYIRALEDIYRDEP